jgi:hypothetical protein
MVTPISTSSALGARTGGKPNYGNPHFSFTKLKAEDATNPVRHPTLGFDCIAYRKECGVEGGGSKPKVVLTTMTNIMCSMTTSI